MVFFLRLTADSVARIEKRMGKAFFSGVGKIQDNLIENLVTILWGAILELDADFTFEQAATLMDQYIDDGHSFEEWMREIDCLLETGGFFIHGRDSSQQDSQSNTRRQ